MSADLRAAQRRRAQLLGRVALAIGIVPALFFVWNSIGLPGIPGLSFGSGGAQADRGLVVRISGTPDARSSLKPFRDRASAVAAAAHRRLGTRKAAGASMAPTSTLVLATETTPSTAGMPGPPLQTEPRAPSVTAHTEPGITPPSEPALQETVPPVALPAVPPSLPTVALPPLPLTPVLPAPTPVNGIAVP